MGRSAEHCLVNIDNIKTYDYREFYNTKTAKETIAYYNLALDYITH